MRPQTLLPLLIGGAVGAGGILQGLHWQQAAAEAGGDGDRLDELREEIRLLERENESLRSLAQGGGEFHVPDALADFTTRNLGLEFRSSPVVHRIAREELRDRITASVEMGFPPNGLGDRELAWSLMGLLAPDDRFAPQLAVSRSLGARSWFDPRSGEAWVTDRFDSGSVPDQAALVRALARILLHQHHPPPTGYPGDERDRARTALHHGAALAVENRFMARQALSIGFTGARDSGDGARELLESLPVFIRGVATFPAQFGLPRARRLLENDGLAAALHAPPTTTAAFEETIDADGFRVPEPPGRADEPVMEESAGFLGFRAWLATIDPDFADFAVHWRGDRYQLYADEDSRIELVWMIALDSADAAASIHEIGEAMVDRLAAADGGGDSRRVRLERDGERTLVFRNLAPE